MPPAAPSGYVLPDTLALTQRVLENLPEAADAKAARALVVRELQAAKLAATAGFEAAFRTAPRQARALITAQAALTDSLGKSVV